MRLLELKPLSDIYAREEDFTADLAENLSVLGLGDFKVVETEVYVGSRKADIIATGEDGVLVVENQFGKADWDHWGRLECYARLSDATVAALVAEDFEDLMIETCRLRNQVDTMTEWHLFQVIANTCDKLHFIRLYTSLSASNNLPPNEYTEFWAPIRSDRSSLFAGAPLNGPQLSKTIRSVIPSPVILTLTVGQENSHIRVRFRRNHPREGEVRAEASNHFPEHPLCDESNNNYAILYFRDVAEGISNRSAWPQIQETLVSMGTEIYNLLTSLLNS